MSHWFHRNPIKATLPVEFEKRSFPSSSDATAICSLLKTSRANLLKLHSDPSTSLEQAEAEFTTYVSLLLGFLNDYSGRTTGDGKLRHSIKAKWSQSLNPNVSHEEQDACYEMASMIVNHAMWLTKHAAYVAAILNEPSEKEAKEIHKSLKLAAGLFKFAQENLAGKLIKSDAGPKEQPFYDLTDAVLNAYINQCKAEAQEIAIARAIELKHSPSLICSLAQSTQILFDAAYEGIKNLDKSVIEKWALYLALKSRFYKSQSYCYFGLDLLARDKCGDAIKTLELSRKYYEETQRICKDYGSTKGVGTQAIPERHQFFLNLGAIINRTAEKCERENGMIYHQKLPAEAPVMEAKAAFGLAEPEAFVYPKQHSLWTPETYDNFNVSKGVDVKDKSNSDSKNVPPAKEIPIPQGNATPGSVSGCVIS